MDILKPVRQEIISTEQIDLKIKDHAIESVPWQYPKNNPNKQEMISTEQIDIEIKDHPIESEPWQVSPSIKFEMDLSKTTKKPFACE